jgi:hypothetical protein
MQRRPPAPPGLQCLPHRRSPRLRRAGHLNHKGDNHLAQRKGTAVVSQSGVIGRPRGRPFAKGQSGNPGGRPIKPKTIEQRKLETDVRMFARERGAEAIYKLAALMRGWSGLRSTGSPSKFSFRRWRSSPPRTPCWIVAMAGRTKASRCLARTAIRLSMMGRARLRLFRAVLLP